MIAAYLLATAGLAGGCFCILFDDVLTTRWRKTGLCLSALLIVFGLAVG